MKAKNNKANAKQNPQPTIQGHFLEVGYFLGEDRFWYSAISDYAGLGETALPHQKENGEAEPTEK